MTETANAFNRIVLAFDLRTNTFTLPRGGRPLQLQLLHNLCQINLFRSSSNRKRKLLQHWIACCAARRLSPAIHISLSISPIARQYREWLFDLLRRIINSFQEISLKVIPRKSADLSLRCSANFIIYGASEHQSVGGDSHIEMLLANPIDLSFVD